jgi:BirA family biotin operon repressor/biotin-[acetyl-CoA-carboxylase] ligase
LAIKTLDSTSRHSVSVCLDEETRAALAAETRFGSVRWVERTGSTNDDLSAEAERGAPEGLVLVADHQTAGRGRLERTWDEHPGDGLLVSVLLRPALPTERLTLAASAAALAARAACREVAGVEVEIKWPNDLLAPSGAKLAGILSVAAAGAVVVGMGLNVHGGPPGSAWLDALAGRRIGRARLAARWRRELDRRAGDWDGVAAEYSARCATVGRAVAVDLEGGRRLEGVAEAVDDNGRLVVRLDGGARQVVSVGDVTHLR